MVVVVIGWPVCDGTAEAEAQISDQTDVDRPGKRKTFFFSLTFLIFQLNREIIRRMFGAWEKSDFHYLRLFIHLLKESESKINLGWGFF